MRYNRRQKYTDKGEPIVWQSADGNLRVVAQPDEHTYDYDFFGDLSEEDIAALQSQIDTFGMWIIFLEEQDTDGDWDWLDNIGSIIPDDDYTLLEAAQEHFLLDKYKPLGLFNWNKQNSKTRFAENFSAPFMDVTFQNTPMQVKHLYHGQHTVDGVEITPHSPYWTTDLALALGHALFGAEQEVTGADLLICSKCDGTHLTNEGEMCYSCDEKGYVLQETFTDDILPQTTPLVLSLDFTEPQTVYFTQDMEHDEGVSYLVQNESFNWSFVPAETLLALLYTWLDTGLPELVEFDTGAGYVEHESSVTKRIQQAIHQLEQSAH